VAVMAVILLMTMDVASVSFWPKTKVYLCKFVSVHYLSGVWVGGARLGLNL